MIKVKMNNYYMYSGSPNLPTHTQTHRRCTVTLVHARRGYLNYNSLLSAEVNLIHEQLIAYNSTLPSYKEDDYAVCVYDKA